SNGLLSSDCNMKHAARPGKNRSGKWLPTWFKVSVSILAALIVLKALGLQVFVEVSFDGIPFLASLTDLEIYLVLLGILLVYILITWLWNRLFGPRGR
ncbi:MAG: hypothetical protein OEN02_11730, partial [Gammaproteobacteria bacterium]|nr:hypothetical protein [Gammaproteobacteria bacterium]